MKRIGSLLVAASFLFLPVQGALAKCTPLINEGHQLLSKANLPKDQASKIKALLDEAAQFRDSGDHATGAKKANEALDLLKKK